MMLMGLRGKRYSGFRRGNGRSGFLLVEVLATLAISAFLLAAMASVVSLLLRTSDRVGAKSQHIEDTGRVLASLSREIQQIVPVRWSGPDGGFVFTGTSQSLFYAREVLADDGTTDMRVVFLNDGSRRLTRSEAQLLPFNTSFSELTQLQIEEVTPPGLVIQFSYFARIENGQEALVDNWNDGAHLPVAIRVALRNDAGAVLGATRIQLRVDAEAGCAALEKNLKCNFTRDAATEKASAKATEAEDQNDALGLER